MTAPLTIVLPGLHGSADLCGPFLAAAPAGFSLRCQPLPNDSPQSYRELAEWVAARLPDKPVALVAESFSGPLALLVGDRCPQVLAVVLCASFVDPPLPGFIALLPSFLWRRPPQAVLSLLLTGGDRALAKAIRVAMASLCRAVVASRIRAALRVDVTAELERWSAPLLCLQAEQDRLLPGRCGARMRAIKPTAEFVGVAAPHLVLQTRPVEAWNHIGPFLIRAAAAGRGVLGRGPAPR